MPRGRIRDKDELREAILRAAEHQITANGVLALKARAVTAEAGCALGALYNAFADLDDLVLHVNARTLKRLDARLKESAEGPEPLPIERLVALARSYLRFALDETPLWRALFEHSGADGGPAPQWLREEQARLFSNAAEPLAELYMSLSAHDLNLRARTLFSAVHGIVSISLEDRFAGVTPDRLDDELANLVRAALAGYCEKAESSCEASD